MQADFIVATRLNWLGHCFDDPFRDKGGTFGLGQIGCDHGKHIARKTRTAILFPNGRPQTARNGTQCFITDIGTKPVIDGTEIVDINDQNSQKFFIAFGVGNSLVKPVVKKGPVGKAGHRVMRCQIAQAIDRCVGRRIVMQGDIHAIVMIDRRTHGKVANDMDALGAANHPFAADFLVTAAECQ